MRYVVITYGGERWQVESDGSVWQWDTVAGHWSRFAAGCAPATVRGRVRAAGLRRLAARGRA